MTTDRIKEIQSKTAYPESVSVQQALLQVWNECEQEQLRIGGVINCTDCDKPLPKDSESNTCTECFYKDRYKYS